eukprot:364787-Chlamydomonas_euryale.AAC.4
MGQGLRVVLGHLHDPSRRGPRLLDIMGAPGVQRNGRGDVARETYAGSAHQLPAILLQMFCFPDRMPARRPTTLRQTPPPTQPSHYPTRPPPTG